MDGRKFKQIVSCIPDDAEVVRLCEKFIAWRVPGGCLSCYSFSPERLDERVER